MWFFGLSLVLVTLLSESCGQRSTSKVVLKDNGYEGVVIAINNDISPALCQEIIQGLQDLMTSTSSVLFRVTKGRASFRSVTVLLPDSWSSQVCPGLGSILNATDETWGSADLRIGMEKSLLHGSRPWTLQTQGCSHRGDFVSLVYDFLLQNNSLSGGRLLAHEWLKYRYGVFEERGQAGSRAHPPHFRAQDASWRPTVCANTRLIESRQCDPKDLTCPVGFKPEENEGLSSSFLSFPGLPSVSELCDEGTHDPEAPTRQNLICSGKSLWEVLRASSDFQNNRNVEGGFIKMDINFKFVKQQKPRIVLLVEDTNVMNVQKRWEFMRKAVRKLVSYDVPDRYSFALVVFDSTATVKYPLTVLSDSNSRENLGSSLPRNPSNEGEDKRCIICGVRESLRILRENGGTAGSHIILVTAGGGSMSERELEDTRRILTSSRVVLHSIVYPMTVRYPRPGEGIGQLAALSGGSSFTVSDEGIGADSKLSMYYYLLDSMYHTLSKISGEKILSVKVHAAEHSGGIWQVSKGSFLIDPSLGEEFTFAIFYYDIAHVGNRIHLISPTQQIIDTGNMQKEDANINMITIRLSHSQVIPGLWHYQVENRADSHQALYIQVTANPRSTARGNYLKVNAWTSHSGGVINITDTSNPLALYVDVRSEIMPISDASVNATLIRLGMTTNNNAFQSETLELFDNGLLSPDITAGDGVYSRVVLGLDSGKYSISIDVSGRHNGFQFSRQIQLGVIDVVGIYPTSDVIPPARITDLRVSTLPGTTNQVVFTWTATGDDLDYGTANQYVVLTSRNRRSLEDGTAEFLEGWPVPLIALTIQQYTTVWEYFDEVYYVAIFAVDDAGNTAPLGNIVSVYIKSPPTTTVMPSTSPPASSIIDGIPVKDGASTPMMSTMDTRQLAVVLGCIGGFIFVTAIVVGCCTVSHRRNRKSTTAKDSQDAHKGYSVTSKGTDFPDNKDSIKREFISPVESWSASQLLSNQQEKRNSVSGRSDNTSDHSASTKKSYSGSSGPTDFYTNGNQYPYPHQPYPEQVAVTSDGYPTPTEGYQGAHEAYQIEGYPPSSEIRSYVGSQQSDSFLSVSCDILPPTNGPPVYSVYPTYDSSLRSTKVPPPIPPKPKVAYTPEPYIYDSSDPHSSAQSVTSEKRIRNVTMV